MMKRTKKVTKRGSAAVTAAVWVAVAFTAGLSCNASSAAASAAGAQKLPAPALDAPRATKATESVVFAGGCFWGVQAVFQHVKGVSEALSGYSGGAAGTAKYDLVSTGDTGHAESVRVTFDPSQVTYGQLLRVFFSVAHDPTEVNRQGPDEGTQYRSVVFFTEPEQQRVTAAYVAQLDRAKALPRPIATQVVPLKAFYPAEAHHQDYATLHPDNPYIVFNDAPKVAHLRELFPELYRKDGMLKRVPRP